MVGVWVSSTAVWKRVSKVSCGALPGSSKVFPCIFSGAHCLFVGYVCIEVVALNLGRWLRATASLGASGDMIESRKRLDFSRLGE